MQLLLLAHHWMFVHTALSHHHRQSLTSAPRLQAPHQPPLPPSALTLLAARMSREEVVQEEVAGLNQWEVSATETGFVVLDLLHPAHQVTSASLTCGNWSSRLASSSTSSSLAGPGLVSKLLSLFNSEPLRSLHPDPQVLPGLSVDLQLAPPEDP